MPKIIKNLEQKLKAEARKQVMTEGYSALNIRDIAKNCGVGVGTVYNYYPSKDALIAGFMLEDWEQCLQNIRNTADNTSDAVAVLGTLHLELRSFLEQYNVLFTEASEKMPAPPRQYHAMLREQIAGVLRPFCDSDFLADFTAEAMLTWTVAGKEFDLICDILIKVL